ncbi:hypothetical protein LUR56_14890 [Streptomyces sp. MT29]|nr:hypothetical protein [Streptomyces sp. MT29]
MVALLPDPEAGRALFAAVREAFRRDGVAAAMATMAAGLAPEEGEAAPGPERAAERGEAPTPEQTAEQAATGEQAPAPEQAATFRRTHANLPVFLEHVLCPFSGYVPDLVALKSAAAHLVVGVGRGSRALLPAVAAEGLARRVGAGVAEFPGGHIGLTEHPGAFAAACGSCSPPREKAPGRGGAPPRREPVGKAEELRRPAPRGARRVPGSAPRTGGRCS